MRVLKRKCQEKYKTVPKQRTALDDLWSLEERRKQRQVHTSQIAGPSKKKLESVYDYSSDSTVEEQSNATIDYDSIHPPSPKISKGGNIKKSKVPQMVENTSKEHKELLIDVDSTASDINAIDTTRSKGEEISAYHSDVTPDRPTANMKDITNKQDEFSSDVDIAPSGIVAKANNYLQCDMINSDSDEGNRKLQGTSHDQMDNKGE